jgi:hypothetical protein
MALKVERVDNWAAPIEDKPGALASALNGLTGAGVNLEFVIARRTPEKKGGGVVFATPIQGAPQTRVAREIGFEKTETMHTVRVEGPNRPGHGLNIASRLAAEGLNLRGFTAAAIDKKFVVYLSFDNAAEAAKAVRILKKI